MSKSITYEVTVDQRATKWKLNGKLHREDGPAIEYAEGNKWWYLNGKLHREDGPAVEYADGTKFWFINDVELSEQQFIRATQPAQELTVAQIEQLLGKRIKIVK